MRKRRSASLIVLTAMLASALVPMSAFAESDDEEQAELAEELASEEGSELGGPEEEGSGEPLDELEDVPEATEDEEPEQEPEPRVEELSRQDDDSSEGDEREEELGSVNTFEVESTESEVEVDLKGDHVGSLATGQRTDCQGWNSSQDGWHFVARGDAAFAELSIEFEQAGLLTLANAIQHPNAKHAYFVTPVGDKLLSGSGKVLTDKSNYSHTDFNLSHTCAGEPDGETIDVIPGKTWAFPSANNGLLPGGWADIELYIDDDATGIKWRFGTDGELIVEEGFQSGSHSLDVDDKDLYDFREVDYDVAGYTCDAASGNGTMPLEAPSPVVSNIHNDCDQDSSVDVLKFWFDEGDQLLETPPTTDTDIGVELELSDETTQSLDSDDFSDDGNPWTATATIPGGTTVEGATESTVPSGWENVECDGLIDDGRNGEDDLIPSEIVDGEPTDAVVICNRETTTPTNGGTPTIPPLTEEPEYFAEFEKTWDGFDANEDLLEGVTEADVEVEFFFDGNEYEPGERFEVELGTGYVIGESVEGLPEACGYDSDIDDLFTTPEEAEDGTIFTIEVTNTVTCVGGEVVVPPQVVEPTTPTTPVEEEVVTRTPRPTTDNTVAVRGEVIEAAEVESLPRTGAAVLWLSVIGLLGLGLGSGMLAVRRQRS